MTKKRFFRLVHVVPALRIFSFPSSAWKHLVVTHTVWQASPPAVESADEPAMPKRRGHGRRRLPQFLPRKQVEHVLSAEELTCPCCGEPRKKIDEEISEQLAYVPASLYIKEHARFTCTSKSDYVHEEFNRAVALENEGRKGTVADPTAHPILD